MLPFVACCVTVSTASRIKCHLARVVPCHHVRFYTNGNSAVYTNADKLLYIFFFLNNDFAAFTGDEMSVNILLFSKFDDEAKILP